MTTCCSYIGRLTACISSTHAATFVNFSRSGGAHVANAGYITAAAARGHGIARLLCLHSLDYTRTAGFRAMQFNFVVSSNAPAVHLWESLGFRTLTHLPNAFAHPRLGFVDALVMWKDLVDA